MTQITKEYIADGSKRIAAAAAEIEMVRVGADLRAFRRIGVARRHIARARFAFEQTMAGNAADWERELNRARRWAGLGKKES